MSDLTPPPVVREPLEQIALIAREVVARLDKWGAPFPLATSIDKLRKPLVALYGEDDADA